MNSQANTMAGQGMVECPEWTILEYGARNYEGYQGEPAVTVPDLFQRRVLSDHVDPRIALPLETPNARVRVIYPARWTYSARLTIPVYLYSPETIGFIGFPQHLIEAVWENFKSSLLMGPATANDSVSSQFLKSALVFAHILGENPEWLKNSVFFGIDDPLFKHVAKLHTTAYWLRESVRVRFEYLLTLEKTLRLNQASYEEYKRTGVPINPVLRRPDPGWIQLFKPMDQGALMLVASESGKTDFSRLVSRAVDHLFLYSEWSTAVEVAMYARRRTGIPHAVLAVDIREEFIANMVSYDHEAHMMRCPWQCGGKHHECRSSAGMLVGLIDHEAPPFGQFLRIRGPALMAVAIKPTRVQVIPETTFLKEFGAVMVERRRQFEAAQQQDEEANAFASLFGMVPDS
ncbi:hypothetical protein EDC01DRAFT_264101 [Geopyxis carbonaria]|nr:hypothetical protein EDC01DRAFT_264101 [Geopyxis carbonaria]